MHSQKRETHKRMGPTPVLPTPVKDVVPEGAPDDDSVASSVYSVHSEPEGEFWDDFVYDGFVHVPEPPPAPNILHEGAGLNVIPEGDDQYRLLRELQYWLLLILDVVLMVWLASILQQNGFEEKMEN